MVYHSFAVGHQIYTEQDHNDSPLEEVLSIRSLGVMLVLSSFSPGELPGVELPCNMFAVDMIM